MGYRLFRTIARRTIPEHLFAGARRMGRRRSARGWRMHPKQYREQREASLRGRKLRTPETASFLGVSQSTLAKWRMYGCGPIVDTQLQIAVVREVYKKPAGFPDAAKGAIVETPSTRTRFQVVAWFLSCFQLRVEIARIVGTYPPRSKNDPVRVRHWKSAIAGYPPLPPLCRQLLEAANEAVRLVPAALFETEVRRDLVLLIRFPGARDQAHGALLVDAFPFTVIGIR
jgi:hypothetical protein